MVINWLKFKGYLKRYGLLLAIFLAALFVLFLRRTDALLHPQFWAEDGTGWFFVAYKEHYSVTSILIPYSGNLHVIPRLVGVISGLFSLRYTPLIFNFFALSIQALPVVYLWTRRFAKVASSTYLRLILTFFYLFLPYTSEVHANLANNQWHFALVAFFIVFLPPHLNKFVRMVELAVLVAMGLSGPFCLFLLLTYGAYHYIDSRRLNIRDPKFIILGLCTLIQITTLILTSSERQGQSIGISIHQLMILLSGQVFAGGLFGDGYGPSFTGNAYVYHALGLIMLSLTTYAILKGPLILKAFVLYVGLSFTASLLSPNNGLPGLTWWESISIPKTGGRYFYLLHLLIFVILSWLVFSKGTRNTIKAMTVFILLVSLLTGIRSNFIHPAYVNYHYQNFVNRYDAAKPGDQVEVLLNPGLFWKVGIEKR